VGVEVEDVVRDVDEATTGIRVGIVPRVPRGNLKARGRIQATKTPTEVALQSGVGVEAAASVKAEATKPNRVFDSLPTLSVDLHGPPILPWQFPTKAIISPVGARLQLSL
jgi:hypothetical protein